MESTMLNKKMDVAFNEDILQNILARLPAVHFASAALVCRLWNQICNRILSRPKLRTALSVNSSLQVAVQEVLDKVLSEPIRPHFAIAFLGLSYNLADIHRLITQKLGSKIPIITNAADGMIGIDARTNEIRETKWDLHEEDGDPNNYGGPSDSVSYHHINYCGIVLVVGCVPGLKVETIPLLRSSKDAISMRPRGPKVEMIDQFLMDIKEYTSSVSDCTSPEAIIMFGDQRVDLNPVLAQMDNNLRSETVIVGDASGCFLFKSGDNSKTCIGNSHSIDAVALIFVKDVSSNVGGQIRFHVKMSNGLLPFGPKLKIASVYLDNQDQSWLTARIVGRPEILDTRGFCIDVRREIKDRNPSFYIGVTHKKAEPQQLGSRPYLAFHEVVREAENWSFAVDGVGIKPGDSFVFYHTDFNTAVSSNSNLYNDFKILKTAASSSTSHPSTSTSTINIYDRVKKDIFGCLIFSGLSRGDSPLELDIRESWPFAINFPKTPLAGQFSSGEIARVTTASLIAPDEEEDGNGGGGKKQEASGCSNSIGCFLHHYSTVYLVMSYTPHPQH
ncbi:hypothetical protein ACOSP7_001116 [Xanthoceras sorbifolium]